MVLVMPMDTIGSHLSPLPERRKVTSSGREKLVSLRPTFQAFIEDKGQHTFFYNCFSAENRTALSKSGKLGMLVNVWEVIQAIRRYSSEASRQGAAHWLDLFTSTFIKSKDLKSCRTT